MGPGDSVRGGKKVLTVIKNPTQCYYIFHVHIQLWASLSQRLLLINNKRQAFKPKCVTLSFPAEM